jgi:hypothetical protein
MYDYLNDDVLRSLEVVEGANSRDMTEQGWSLTSDKKNSRVISFITWWVWYTAREVLEMDSPWSIE